MGSLSNLYISQSYQSLIHLGTDTGASGQPTQLQDGLGTNIGVYVNTNGEVSASSFSGSISGIGNVSAFSSSVNSRILAITGSTTNTGSLVTTSSFNAYTASQDFKNTTFATTSSLTNLSASLYFTDTTQSVNIASISTSVGLLQTFSGSQYKTDSASFDSRILAITSSGGIPAGTVSSSAQITAFGFATTGSNTFTGVNIFNQQVDIKSGSAILLYSNTNNITDAIGVRNTSGSFEVVKVGSSNKVDLQNLSLLVSGAITASGNISSSGNIFAANLTGSTIDTGSLVTTASFNAYTASQDFKNTTFATTSSLNSLSASIFSTEATQSSLINGKLDTSSFNTFSTSVDSRLDGIELKTGSFATTGSNVFIGNQTISGSLFVSGSEVLTGTLSASALRVENNTYLDGQLRVTNDAQFDTHILIQGAQPHLKLRDTSGGGFSSGYDIRIDTGSFQIYDDTHNRDVLSDFFNSASQQHTTSLTSEIIVISGSTSVTLLGNVSASIISASTINGLGDPLAFSTSVDSRLDNLELGSASVSTSVGLLQTFSSSQYKTDSASFDSRIIAATINTSSFATTGSNNFIGNQRITGSLILSSSAAVELQVIGAVEITGSVAGNITALSVASSTASIDFNLGTFFTLTIPSSSITYITGSNLKSGMTANIILTQQATTGSVRFESSLFKFPSGSINTGSAVASAVDLVSVMSVGTTTLYSVGANQLL